MPRRIDRYAVPSDRSLAEKVAAMERRLDAMRSMVTPQPQAPWESPTASASISATSYTTAWQSRFVLSANSIKVVVSVTAPASNTGQVRVKVGASFYTSPQTIPANTTTTFTFSWNLENQGIDLGTEVNVQVQVRRTSGASSLAVSVPTPVTIADAEVISATDTGI